MTKKSLALRIRNDLQLYGINADPDMLFDVILESLIENSDNTKPTLRDQFAMSALQGILAAEANPCVQSVIEPTTAGNAQHTTNFAYLLADKMMMAREAKGGA